MSKLRILHLSDLHVRAESEVNQRTSIEAAMRDVAAFGTEKPIDLIVFSGDLAFAGKDDQFHLGRVWLLDPLLRWVNGDHSRIVIAVGNHDVDRDQIEEIYESGLVSRLRTKQDVAAALQSQKTRSRMMERVQGWVQFTDDYYEQSERHVVAPGTYWSRTQINGADVGTAVFNSSWRSCGAGPTEIGQMIIGEALLAPTIRAIEDAEIRLVVVHHPPNWLTDFERDAFIAETARVGAIVLTGHEHQADPIGITGGSGHAIHDRCGCLYQSLDYHNGFTFLDVDLDKHNVHASLRSWQTRRRVYDAAVDVAHGGVVDLPLPAANSNQIIIPQSRIDSQLVEIVQATSVVAEVLPDESYDSVDEFLVTPRFYPAPYRELRAAVRASRDEAKTQPLRVVDAIETVAGERVTIVSGDPESGVTASLAWLLGAQYQRHPELIPVYIKFPSGHRAKGVEDQVRARLRSMGLAVDRKEKLAGLAVAIDDITSRDAQALTNLVRHVRDHPENKYVLGCHGSTQSRIAAAFEGVGISHGHLFLGPFGRRELRLLVAKMLRAPSAPLVSQVLRALSENRLPRIPFLMAALTAILSQHPDAQVLNPSMILDAYVELRLGKMSSRSNRDYRNKEHLLEHLAGLLIRSSESHRLPLLEVEEAIVEYFKELGQVHQSSVRILHEFIDRRILSVDEVGDVGFRHESLLELFAAKLFNDDTGFAADVMEDPLKYAGTVIHAMGLRKNETELLRSVGELAHSQLVLSNIANSEVDAILDYGDASQSRFQEVEPLLKTTAPQSSKMTEEQIDSLYEGFAADPDEDRIEPSELPREANLGLAVDLLSSVLAYSELITDLPLRTRLLKESLQGWGLFAASLLRPTQESRRLSKMLEQAIFEQYGRRPDAEELDRITRISLVTMLVLRVTSGLRGRAIEGLLPSVLSDKEHMGTAINAFLSVIMACDMETPGWASALVRVYDEHHDHLYVNEVIMLLASSYYQSPDTDAESVRILEDFLVRVHGQREAHGRTRPQRDMQLNALRMSLQRARLKAKMDLNSVSILDDSGPADEVDPEEVERDEAEQQ